LIPEGDEALFRKEVHLDPDGLASELTRLYQEVDLGIRPLLAIHSARIQCRRGCHPCCADNLTVFEIEAENVRSHHSDLLAGGNPHPEGACAFLDPAGACRIYEHRPYVCRTQGLPLRWMEHHPNGTFTEMRDICPLNDKGQPVEALPEEQCWTIGPIEGKLARLQASMDGGALRRVSLRSLFDSEPEGMQAGG
jgi:Fe-S-cluster containining protein